MGGLWHWIPTAVSSAGGGPVILHGWLLADPRNLAKIRHLLNILEEPLHHVTSWASIYIYRYTYIYNILYIYIYVYIEAWKQQAEASQFSEAFQLLHEALQTRNQCQAQALLVSPIRSSNSAFANLKQRRNASRVTSWMLCRPSRKEPTVNMVRQFDNEHFLHIFPLLGFYVWFQLSQAERVPRRKEYQSNIVEAIANQVEHYRICWID